MQSKSAHDCSTQINEGSHGAIFAIQHYANHVRDAQIQDFLA